MSRFLRLPLVTVISFILAAVLAACGTVPSATVTPSVAPVVIPTTVQQTGTKTVSLLDALNGVLTVTAPNGLATRPDSLAGAILVATSDAALSSNPATFLAADQWALDVSAVPIKIAQALVPAGQTVAPQTMIDALKTEMAQSAPQVTFSPSTAITIGGHDAARVTGTSPQGEVLLIVVALDSGYIMTTSVISVGQLATYEPTITTIITSAMYTPAA